MGSTLTNTQPKDTYKSLLKTTDSTELSGTLKTVSDGNGNDSALALSTSAAQVSGNINVTGSLNGFAGATHNLLVDWSGNSQFTTLTATDVFFGTNAQERLRITSDGYVRLASGTGGIQFSGDVAAANSLDDYEEGTFTPTMGGATFSLTIASGYYTKIGRQVSIYIDVEGTYSSPTATFYVNLPFNVLGGSRGEGVVRPINGVTFTNYVTCEAVSTSLFFEDCYPSTGSASVDMNSSNFNSGGFRFFAQTSFFV